MKHTITLIPGDGIGPQIAESAKKIIEAAGVEISWEVAYAGLEAFERTGDTLPQATISSIKKNRVALKGPLTTPVGTGFRSVNVALRKEFDLFVNFRPVKSFEGTRARYEHIDLVIFRENTEGLYTGSEDSIDPERTIARATSIITRAGSERIVRAAFEYARLHHRKRVTIVHKANILKNTSGLFLEAARSVAKEFPEIESNDRIVDNMAMQMVMNPWQFDVIVTTNLFGDILSDLASGLVGGLGMAPGANIGLTTAIFEAVHGSAPDIAGKNIANPCALVLAGTLMLRHIGENAAAETIERAIARVVKEGKYCTPDITADHSCSTNEMTEAIIKNIK